MQSVVCHSSLVAGCVVLLLNISVLLCTVLQSGSFLYSCFPALENVLSD